MPIFEDINYEIQDEKVFKAVSDCRKYIYERGTRCLVAKIWYVCKKYNLPYTRVHFGETTVKEHIYHIMNLEKKTRDAKIRGAFWDKVVNEDRVQQAMPLYSVPVENSITKPCIGVSIFADTIEEVDAIEAGLDGNIVVLTSELFNRLYPTNTTLVGTRLDYHRVKFIDERPVDVQAQEAINKFMALTNEQKIEYIRTCKA